jgi:chromosome segregation ATPase
MSNADSLHREQLQQVGNSLREALATKRQQAQHAEQQWSAEKAELTASLQAAEEHVSAYQAGSNEGYALVEKLRGTVQGLKQSISEVHQVIVDRDADAAKLLDNVTKLRADAETQAGAVRRHYAESLRDYSKTSAAIYDALQDIDEQLLHAVNGDDQADAEQ